MKRRNRLLIGLLAVVLITVSIFFLLNLEVSIRQGIDYQLHTVKLPLYLKMLDFFDRHYNYKLLVERITKDARTNQECVLKIFEWTIKNIRKVPNGFPVVDDHVLNIITRGYGTNDQISDVFTTLCNYAGVNAFFSWVPTKDQSSRIPLSFVKISKRWLVFDPYNGIYFKNNYGEIASAEEIISDLSIINQPASLGFAERRAPAKRGEPALLSSYRTGYVRYYENLTPPGDVGFSKGKKQMPVPRFIFELKKAIGIEK